MTILPAGNGFGHSVRSGNRYRAPLTICMRGSISAKKPNCVS